MSKENKGIFDDHITSIKNLEKEYENRKPKKGLITGIPDWDGDRGVSPLAGLTIITGQAGSGKSTLAIQFALNYIQKGGKVVFLSNEEGKEGFGANAIEIYAQMGGEEKHKIKKFCLMESRNLDAIFNKAEENLNSKQEEQEKKDKKEGKTKGQGRGGHRLENVVVEFLDIILNDKTIYERETTKEDVGKEPLVLPPLLVIDSINGIEGAVAAWRDREDRRGTMDALLRGLNRIVKESESNVFCACHANRTTLGDFAKPDPNFAILQHAYKETGGLEFYADNCLYIGNSPKHKKEEGKEREYIIPTANTYTRYLWLVKKRCSIPIHNEWEDGIRFELQGGKKGSLDKENKFDHPFLKLAKETGEERGGGNDYPFE